MRNQTPIKKCPFCTAQAAAKESLEFKGLFYVMCSFCHSQTGLFNNKQHAIEAWNSRYHYNLDGLAILALCQLVENLGGNVDGLSLAVTSK